MFQSKPDIIQNHKNTVRTPNSRRMKRKYSRIRSDFRNLISPYRQRSRDRYRSRAVRRVQCGAFVSQTGGADCCCRRCGAPAPAPAPRPRRASLGLVARREGTSAAAARARPPRSRSRPSVSLPEGSPLARKGKRRPSQTRLPELGAGERRRSAAQVRTARGGARPPRAPLSLVSLQVRRARSLQCWLPAAAPRR